MATKAKPIKEAVKQAMKPETKKAEKPKGKIEIAPFKPKKVKESIVKSLVDAAVAPQAEVAQLPAGAYYLHNILTGIGFPGFQHDYVRLLDKGIVKVNGETVLVDAIYDVTADGILIDVNDKSYRVVGVTQLVEA